MRSRVARGKGGRNLFAGDGLETGDGVRRSSIWADRSPTPRRRTGMDRDVRATDTNNRDGRTRRARGDSEHESRRWWKERKTEPRNSCGRTGEGSRPQLDQACSAYYASPRARHDRLGPCDPAPPRSRPCAAPPSNAAPALPARPASPTAHRPSSPPPPPPAEREGSDQQRGRCDTRRHTMISPSPSETQPSARFESAPNLPCSPDDQRQLLPFLLCPASSVPLRPIHTSSPTSSVIGFPSNTDANPH